MYRAADDEVGAEVPAPRWREDAKVSGRELVWLVGVFGAAVVGGRAAQRLSRAGHCCWSALSPEPLPFCEGNFRSSPVLPPVKGDKYLMTSVVRLLAVGRLARWVTVIPGLCGPVVELCG